MSIKFISAQAHGRHGGRILQTIKHRGTIWPSNSTPSYTPKRNEIIHPHTTCTWMFRAAPSITAKQWIQPNVYHWTNKQTMVYARYGIWFSHKKATWHLLTLDEQRGGQWLLTAGNMIEGQRFWNSQWLRLPNSVNILESTEFQSIFPLAIYLTFVCMLSCLVMSDSLRPFKL